MNCFLLNVGTTTSFWNYPVRFAGLSSSSEAAKDLRYAWSLIEVVNLQYCIHLLCPWSWQLLDSVQSWCCLIGLMAFWNHHGMRREVVLFVLDLLGLSRFGHGKAGKDHSSPRFLQRSPADEHFDYGSS